MNLQELFLLNLLDQWNQPEAIGSPPLKFVLPWVREEHELEKYYLGVCPN